MWRYVKTKYGIKNQDVTDLFDCQAKNNSGP